MSSYEHLKCDVSKGIGEIVFDRPDVYNAFNRDMIEEIVRAIIAAQSDDRVYVIVLSGSGKGFCSGADVSEGFENRDQFDAAERLWKVQSVVRHLYHGSKPTVAAVNGPALGAGCDFALACDMRIIEDDAYMRQQFVNIGLVPGDGGGWLLPRLVGEAKAKEYILTGRDITPEAAEEMGLVVDVVDSGDSLEVARDLAAELRDKPSAAVRNCKQLIDVTQSYEDYARAAIEAQWEATDHPEHAEAISALQENREPDYNRDY